jgi:hypothetical protein
MFIVKRERGRRLALVVAMPDDGLDYYTFLVRVGEHQTKERPRVDSHVGLVLHPSAIQDCLYSARGCVCDDIRECVVVGPLPRSACHKLALDLVRGPRGFAAQASKMQYLVEHAGIASFMKSVDTTKNLHSVSAKL